MFKQLETKKFNQQIVDQIRGLIENGTLKKGDRLPSERVLSEKFGTSRASIREATSAMAMMGIIESRSGSGNYIKINIEESTIDEALISEILIDHDLFDIYEARQEIEPSLIYLASIRRTEKDLKELKEILQHLLSIANQISSDFTLVEEYMETDRRFHIKIAEMGHNPILFKLYASISLLLKEEFWMELKRKDILANGLQQTELEHIAIVKAIEDGDPERAKKDLLVHLDRIRKGLFSGLKNN